MMDYNEQSHILLINVQIIQVLIRGWIREFLTEIRFAVWIFREVFVLASTICVPHTSFIAWLGKRGREIRSVITIH